MGLVATCTFFQNTQTIRIWDLWIRLFHWSLAAIIVLLLVSGETGWMFLEWYRIAGEIAFDAYGVSFAVGAFRKL